MLAGVYAGLVLLATQVFRVHTPVAVAAATLAAPPGLPSRSIGSGEWGNLGIRDRLPVW